MSFYGFVVVMDLIYMNEPYRAIFFFSAACCISCCLISPTFLADVKPPSSRPHPKTYTASYILYNSKFF